MAKFHCQISHGGKGERAKKVIFAMNNLRQRKIVRGNQALRGELLIWYGLKKSIRNSIKSKY